MKIYLMAGGLLLTAASVYGVADYVKTKNQKEFKNLYKELPAQEKTNVKITDLKEEDYSRGKLETSPPAPVEIKTAVATNPEKTNHTKIKKTKKVVPAPPVKKTGPDNTEVQPTSVELKDNITPQPEAITVAAPKEKKTVRKKVSMKMFSRAAPVMQEIKTEEKKQ
jgi:hypothetical protein